MENNYLTNSPTNATIANALKNMEQSVYGLCYWPLSATEQVIYSKAENNLGGSFQ